MSEQKLLVVKGSGGGGLGDRVRAALVGMLYAQLSGRYIFVDWTDGVYGPTGVNAFNRLFNIQNIPSLSQISDTSDTRPTAWSGRLACSMDQVWNEDGNTFWDRAAAIARYSFDLGQLSYPERVLVMWDFDQLDALRPHLPAEQAGMDMETLLAHAYQRYLSPVIELKEEALQALEGITGETIGMHVRATREARVQKGSIPMQSYFREVDRLLGLFDADRIIVCTDNSDVEREILARYPLAWSREKWFAQPGESLHLNESCPDKLQLAKDAVLDMLLLARCDWLISAQNSSFSILARIMSHAPKSHQVQLSPAVSLKTRLGRRIRSLMGP